MGDPKPGEQDSISVGDVDFGDDFPVMSNARVRPSEKTGRIVSVPLASSGSFVSETLLDHQRIEVDVDYSDHVALSLDTKVVINFPTPRFAVLPISLGITLARFQATVRPTLCPHRLGSS